ncbi:transglycosylase domain-containing protein [Microbacterium sp. B2969]|uniref:Transglycosylase domain-containing protein n=1 Tax=Microbacterium alkaliflavum TaxID=3248839 RepID=A0ABW7Q387_9MICO
MPDTKRTTSGVLGGLAGLVGLSAVAGVLVAATVTPAIALSGAAASSAITMFDNLPSVLEIEKLMLPSTLIYTDPSSGQEVEWTQFYDQNRSPVEFDQIAPVMYDAILSSEDKNFYKHGGIDLVGTVSAVVDNVRGRDTRGGSSISQQYVKNILVQRCESNATSDEELQKCYTDATTSVGDEGLQRKLQEMRYAIALEQKYSKNEILLGYLNIAGFGGTNYGVDAAARYYFGVAAKDLSLAQAATLAGMVQNPNTYRIDMKGGTTTDKDGNGVNSEADGYKLTKARQVYVLDRMLADGKITQEQHDAAVAEPLTPNITQPTKGCASTGSGAYFCQYVVSIVKTDPAFGATADDRMRALRQGGLKIYTTMDPRVQQANEAAVAQNTPSAIDGMDFGSTSVSLEASTGRILGIAQNTKFSEDQSLAGDPNYSSLVYAGNSTNGGSIGFPAGSTFKLFTLLDWLEKGKSLNETLNGVNRVFPKMTNSCYGNWVNTSKTKIGNYNNVGGHVGTPMQFTKESLNSGFLAMAEKLDLCDIAKVVAKMGVTTGDGKEIKMLYAPEVIGSDNVSPLAMASAYATVANNGIRCEPKAIDKVVDPDGREFAPQKTCTQVLDPSIAATAAYALQGVMASGGTGNQGNPNDGTPLIGKTGTHEAWQTWLIESSTKVTTAVWVGNAEGEVPLAKQWYNGQTLNNLRYAINKKIMSTVDDLYGGDAFPKPNQDLLRQVLTDLPNVVGLSVDDAKSQLEGAGFEVVVGDPVDSNQGAGLVAAQNPAAGKVAGGSVVTLSPSNGNGVTVPSDVAGRSVSEAISYLRSSGFGNVQPGTCTEDAKAKGNGTATGTNPPAGTVVNRNATITVDYKSQHCSQ